MKKIGKRGTFCFFLALLIPLFLENAVAQSNISVKATVSEAVVYTGEILELNITVSGDFNKISRPELPDIEGFALMNPIPSTSRHFSYFNGVSNTSYTYSFYLRARQTGTYTIPAVSVLIDEKKYTTNLLKVEVIDRNNTGDGDASSQPGIFLRMKVSDRSVVPGQQIIANVVLYFKDDVQVNSYQPIPGWKAEGFWKERLESSRRPQVKSVILSGVRYNKARLLQFALFPTKTGELTLSPYHVKILAQTVSNQRNPFSSIFGSFADRRRLELETEPVTIEVEPLPEASGAKYTGAVGSFSIQREISADSVQVGETIEIKTTISGTGNIPLLTKPEYNLPSGLEVYQPQTTVQINRSGARIHGSKTFTDIVVPRNQGEVTIPAVTLSWYSPVQSEFIKEKLPAKTIAVRVNINGGTARTNLSRNAISPITGLVNWSSSRQQNLLSYWWFWAGLLLPIIGASVGYWRKIHTEKLNNNFNFARSLQAAETAEKRLNEAIASADDGRLKQAYNSLQKALTGFISDKLGMPEAGLSVEQYVEALEERKVNKDLIRNVRMLLNKCATINYAPDTSSAYLKSHVGLAESIIKKLKKEL